MSTRVGKGVFQDVSHVPTQGSEPHCSYIYRSLFQLHLT